MLMTSAKLAARIKRNPTKCFNNCALIIANSSTKYAKRKMSPRIINIEPAKISSLDNGIISLEIADIVDGNASRYTKITVDSSKLIIIYTIFTLNLV